MLKYTIIALALIHTALSLKCHVQKTFLTEDGTELTECTNELGQKFNKFIKEILDPTFVGKETGDLQCVKASIKVGEDWKPLKGCGFKDNEYCKYATEDKTKDKVKECKVCGDEGCNPATRPTVSFGVLAFLGLAAILAKFY